MAFVNQFQPLQPNEDNLKLLKVICQKPGINETGYADFSSIDGLTFDPTLGLLLRGAPISQSALAVLPAPADPFVGPVEFISGGKVFNAFTVRVNVFANGVLITPTPLLVPVTGQIECPCAILPTDNIQKHDVEFVGASITGAVLPGVGPVVRITLTTRLCLVVSRETIVRVSAATPFC